MKRAMIPVLAAVLLQTVMAFGAVSAPVAKSSLRYQKAQRTHAPMYRRQHRQGTAMPSALPVHPRAALNPLASPTMNLGFFAGSIMSAGGQSFGTPAVGDFNGDGNLDVAVIVSNDFGLTFSMAMIPGNGDGTFGTPVLTPSPYGYSDILYAADFDNDGRDDLILVHSGNSTGSFEVFLSTGGGNFANPVSYSESAANPAAVAMVDLNGDGNLDVVIADGLPAPDDLNPVPSVSTLLGNGDGTFNSPTRVPYPGPIEGAVFADVNGDGQLDLVSNTQVILASSGTYLPPVNLVPPVGQTSCAALDGVVTVADVNGDLHPDIATADCQNDTVTVYLNNGNGTFQTGISYWAGFYPQGLAIGDINGDGKADIVAANADSSDVTVLLGNGNGTFQIPQVGFSVGGFPWAKPVLADFNKDSHLDVVSANYVPDVSFALTYLKGFGDGTFAAARDYYSPQPPAGGYAYGIGVASADFNNDGKPDFVLGNSGGSTVGVSVFLGNSTGLQSGVNYGSGGAFNFVATGDFNSDGQQDIVASDNSTGNIDLFLGNGDGTFQNPTVIAAGTGWAQGLVAADFNGDHKPDIAVVTGPNNVVVLLNNGSGGFNAPISYTLSSQGSEIAAADLNGDGILDLIIPQSESNFVSILLGKGDGTFTAQPDFDLVNSYPVAVAVGDWNGDGKNDLAVTIDDYDGGGMGVAVAFGNGDGTFQPPTLYPSTSNTGTAEPYPSEIRALDVDQDGNLDLVYVNSEFGTVGVLYGSGSGTFGSPKEFPAGGYPYGLVMMDVNGDGGVDAVLGGDSFSGLTVLLNSAGSSISLASSSNPSVSGGPVTFTATVTAGARGVRVIPSGTVTFNDGGSALGSGTLSGGQATFTTSALTAGSHSITASYSGDSSFFQTTSAALTQVVNSGGSTPGYQVSASPSSATIPAGESTNFTVTVDPINGYMGTVILSCGPLPAGVSCLFNPPFVTPSSGPSQSVLTVETATTSAANQPSSRRMFPLWASGFFGLILIEGISRRRRIALGLFAISLFVILTLTGCGGGSSTSTHAVNAAHTIRVIASSATGGVTSQQVAISITIQN